jgi:hypothetical protein
MNDLMEKENCERAGDTDVPRIRWRLGILAAVAVTLLSLIPQIQLWLSRGVPQAVAYNQGLGDEVAYAAYVKALIDGRPRLSDPYTGRDNVSGTKSESLFSIQFIPAYSIALPARLFGVSATTAFIILSPVVAFCSALVLFWLFALVTRNDGLAAAGVLVVLCLGAVASAEGMLASLTGQNTHFDFFPFLRRYQPAASFPLFLLLFVLVWKSLNLEKKGRTLAAVAAGVTFALLVFSYFYLWTAAAAWLAVVAVLWLVARPADLRLLARAMAIIGLFALTALVPYFVLISRRSETAGSVQALVNLRRPDLLAVSELIGGLVLVVLIAGVARAKIELVDRGVIFAMSFALLPFIVLNQQLLTGRIMQPIHYKGFVTNYSVLIAMVLTAGLSWRTSSAHGWKLSKRALVWIAIAAFEWGSIESYQAAKRSAVANEKAADEMAVYTRLNEQTRDRNDWERVVLFNDLRMADGAPAAAPFAVLWAPHLVVYSGTTTIESKERLYRHLYYTGVGVKELDDYFKGRNVYYGCAVGLFGFDRLIDGLNPNAKPISRQEMDDELRSYAAYVASFDRERASSPRLSYVVTPITEEPDLANLDRWYQRDAGEIVGKFKLYRVALRDEKVALSKPTEPARP